MHDYKQKRLPLEEQDMLEQLWEGFPAASQAAVIEQYARLIATAVREETTANPVESRDDQNSGR